MINLTIEDHGLMRRLELIGTRSDRIPPDVWDDIGTIIIRSIHMNFLVGGRPRWKPSKKIAAGGGGSRMGAGTPEGLMTGGQTLVGFTQTLMNSPRLSAMGDDFLEVSVGEGLPYAAIHQSGGTIRQVVTPRQDKYFYAMYKQTGDEMWLAMYIKYRYKMEKGKIKFPPPLIINIPERTYALFQREDVVAIKGLLADYFLGR